jgi:hypothetical protein
MNLPEARQQRGSRSSEDVTGDQPEDRGGCNPTVHGFERMWDDRHRTALDGSVERTDRRPEPPRREGHRRRPRLPVIRELPIADLCCMAPAAIGRPSDRHRRRSAHAIPSEAGRGSLRPPWDSLTWQPDDRECASLRLSRSLTRVRPRCSDGRRGGIVGAAHGSTRRHTRNRRPGPPR